MKEGEYVAYSIEVSGIDPNSTEAVSNELHRFGVPRSYQKRPTPTTIKASRLCTFWRGDDQELDWQKMIYDMLPSCIVGISSRAWSPLKGYPKVTEGWNEQHQVE